MALRVAVIGAGPLGLMAVKNMKEAGLDVTCFEARSWIGGLWKYSDDESLSVASTTIFNSSKYRSAISDYPFPADVDDYPTWRQMLEYMQGYADHFQLRPHIQLNTRVAHVSREGDAWVVELLTKDESRREYFDKVAVASGSFTAPKRPNLPGIEQFTGRNLHAIDFHRPETFQGHRVLLVGLHASAAFSNVRHSWNFFPAPSIATTTPLIADEIYPLLESGFCEHVAAVANISGPKTVVLKDGRVLDDIDAIIYTLTQPLTDHLRWMDNAAGTDVWQHFGWFSRKAWSFWWNNRKLYNLCASGFFTPTIW